MANVRAVNPGRFCVYCQKEFKNQIAAEQHMVTKHGRIEPRVIQSADDAVVTDTTITHWYAELAGKTRALMPHVQRALQPVISVKPRSSSAF